MEKRIGKMLIGLATCLAVAMMIGVAEATVLVDDDFDSDALGANPAGWFTMEPHGDIYVSNNIVVPGSAKSVYFNETGTNNSEIIYMRRDFSGATQELCIVDFYFQAEQIAQVEMKIQDGTVNINRPTAKDDGYFKYYDGGWHDTEVPWTSDTWYHIKYAVNVNDKTWDWYVDDALIASNLSWYSASATEPDRLFISGIYPAGGTGTWYIDDVTVEAIPEPGTGLLLLGGMMGLLFLRRRRRIS